MSVRMRILSVNGLKVEGPTVYLASYDPDAHNGRGAMTVTEDPAKALLFPDAGAAMERWRATSTVRPRREDGKPNRPLSACTVEIEATS